MVPKLNEKQRRFVQEYLLDLNATGAYRRAGYAARGNAAEAGASRLLRNAKVAEAVQSAQAERAERVKVDADWVVRMLVENLERAMQKTEVFDREGRSLGEFRYEGSVANGALKLIGDHLGMYTKNLNVNAGVVNFTADEMAKARDFARSWKPPSSQTSTLGKSG